MNHLKTLVAGLGLALAGTQASAQDYPDQPVRLIVPYSAGGGTDLSARLLQPHLADALGTAVVVENRPGGGGWVGWTELKNAKPDGYTIGYVNLPNLVVGYLNPDMQRSETWQDYDFLTNHVVDSGVVLIRPDDDRFGTAEELVAYAKEHTMSISSSGIGSATHFAGLKLNAKLGTNFKFIHAGGTSDSVPQLLGGTLDVLTAGVGEATALIDNGDAIPVAVFGDKRNEMLPDVPTITEVTGVAFDQLLRRAIAAPKGLDPAVRDTLVSALVAAQTQSPHREDLAKVGLLADDLSGEALVSMVSQLEADIIAFKPELGW
ncbi:Bug family tripartite tricarboxylate transporter substrate binding protein [Salipiger thiooxidans]|uniref:Bug family tripartite tricarboxylate transporter substrate binding protein n=1 Tax=Salipiger thiooxidans TaxID=282683 RepID=UPI001CD4A466|nr:tripartite tricarboxylate transporter substrate binding protein [Salipiger thiooxidans]MCA0849785.1 tripartite tricarboxylate transporter substrate binding protein [Salipiger thiooxidans]